ncbi:YlxR family protein [Nocardioides mangrovi]|uniref:YlxR family protein n=1 Tax=Nocardioides mangrovi TaxID=2874580 RepID=A0ABS7UJ37_9ACTN|nr:YlxR family protein [Nocardioides mangrovi]MBZ5741053.1 YlxR family protein [Nocardioides mangrovi]
MGCRKRAAKAELLRVTAGSDPLGQPAVVPDPTATAPGRGAHLHPTSECYDLAVRRKAFGRALRVTTGLSSAPVGDYLDSRTDQPLTDRNWSSSS